MQIGCENLSFCGVKRKTYEKTIAAMTVEAVASNGNVFEVYAPTMQDTKDVDEFMRISCSDGPDKQQKIDEFIKKHNDGSLE